MNDTNISTNNTSTGISRRDARQAEKMQERPTFAPSVDIYENRDELLIIADLPGVARDGVKINLEKLELTIEGRRSDAFFNERKVIAAEGAPYDYRRSFLLPQGIDAEKISAELANGTLRVHLPKSAAQKPRQIQVKAG